LRPWRHAVEAGGGNDRIDLVQRFRILDHRHQGHFLVGCIHMLPDAAGAESAGAGGVGEAPLAAAIAAGGRHVPGLLGRIDMRHQGAGSTVIEHREDAGRRRLRHPHDAGGPGSACCQQRAVDGDPVPRGMFLIDHDEIEAHAADDLDRMGSRGFDEGANQMFPRQEALTELGGNRNAGHVTSSNDVCLVITSRSSGPA
jgi:hypothetical protein